MYTQKLTMKAATTMSLNERFTALRNLQPAPPPPETASSSALLRAKNREQFQASLRNRRLAMQMASRPSVMAALKLKKKSLKQRLGQVPGAGVKSRLGGPTQGSWRGSWNPSPTSGLKSRLGATPTTRGRPPYFRRDAAGPPQRSPSNYQGRGSFNQGNNRFFRGRGRGGGFRGGMQYRPQQQQQQQPQRGGGARGGATAATRGRGGRGGWNRAPPPSKEALDNDLDQYMSRTKMSIS